MKFIPEGMSDNSPAFQRRGQYRMASVPKGRLKKNRIELKNDICGMISAVPAGLISVIQSHGVKTPGYVSAVP